MDIMKEAMFWDKLEDEQIRCELCAHHCNIKEGKRGLCNVREYRERKLYSLVYGKAASLVSDPIEKKPLYHFFPGTYALSFGTMGCNFSCEFCQNASLSCGSPTSAHLREYSVKDIVREALKYDGIAWTYNEPTVSYEFSYDVFREYKKKGDGYTAYVTNGYMESEPLKKLAPYLDAMNIDIKAFTDKFYREVVGGKLQPVLDTATRSVELDIHVEVTYLIIPGHNDEPKELSEFSSWVKENLGEDTAVHFSRFHPDHRMRHVPPTPTEKMEEAQDIAVEHGLNYVYLGNLPADNNTYCPGCGTTILSRSYFSSGKPKIKDGKCKKCGRKIPIIY